MPFSDPTYKPDFVKNMDEVLEQQGSRSRRWLVNVVLLFAGFILFFLLLFIIYLGFCFIDRRPPIKNMVYKAEDTYQGDPVKVSNTFERTRVCEYTYLILGVDKNGRRIYQEEGERMANGPLLPDPINVTNTYRLDKQAAVGPAIMTLYASWRCPYNLVHKVLPITKEYSDTFEILPPKKD